MEKNTVLLSLNDYNKLRAFKEEIEGGKILKITYDSGSYGSTHEFYTTDEIVKELTIKNDILQRAVSALKGEIGNLKYPKPKEKTSEEILREVKGMSILAFIKWRRK